MTENSNNSIISLSHNDFDDFLNNNSQKIIIVYFRADWCEPCKGFSEVYTKISNDQSYQDVLFANVDVDKEEDLAKDFNIRSVPTVIIFREHVALAVESGVLTEVDLKNLLDDAAQLDMNEVQKNIAKKMLE